MFALLRSRGIGRHGTAKRREIAVQLGKWISFIVKFHFHPWFVVVNIYFNRRRWLGLSFADCYARSTRRRGEWHGTDSCVLLSGDRILLVALRWLWVSLKEGG